VKPSVAWLLTLLGAVYGCEDPLKSVERIEEPRVLAARVEVEGDPGRASPAPGETVHLSLLVATPTGDAFSGLALVACPALARGRGLPSCHLPPLASLSTGPGSQRPSFDFSLPTELDADESPHLLVLGRVCPGATGSVDGEQTRCSDGGGLRVSVDVDLARAGASNTNPAFAADGISFDGAPFPALPVPASDGCQGLGLPELAPGGEHLIAVALPDGARDELVQETSADLPRETLELAHFVSAGELDHVFTRILPDATELGSVVRFSPPAEVAASGTLVRLWFVVRDGRGGSDFTERALCVLP
jgi:hypothetical protein